MFNRHQIWFLFLLCGFLGACSDGSDGSDGPSTTYQQFYQAMDTTISISTMTDQSGETLYYIDEGPRDGKVVLIVTGTGTSVTAALLTTHLKILRDQLNIRLISVQRGGLGERVYKEGWGYGNYVAEVASVLDALNVENFHIFGISGGGPYSAYLAEALGDRILSLHLAATITGNTFVEGEDTLPPSLDVACAIAGEVTPIDNIKGLLGSFVLPSSEVWWGFSEDNPLLQVAGFEDAAETDWEYTFFSRNTDESLTAEAAELLRYCTVALPDLSGIVVPVYIYQGLSDTSAPLNNVDAWLGAFVSASAATVRWYPDEGHWVQYSHLEQIYTDISKPGYLVICDADGKTVIAPESEAEPLIAQGGAEVGLCTAASELF